MFKVSGSVITIALLGGIASYVWYKIYNLNSELEQVTHVYHRCMDKVSHLNLELAIKNSNIRDLNESLHIANSHIERLTLDKKTIEEEFKIYKEKPLSSKIPNKELSELLKSKSTIKSTCDYGLELNAKIKELKYEDL